MDERSKRTTQSKQRPSTWWRTWLAGIFVALAAIALVGSVVTRYIQRNILDTQGFTAIVGPLPQDPAVASALATFTTNKVFDAVNTEASIKDFLPSNLEGLAGPLSDTLQKKTNQIAQDFIKSDAFNSIWLAANQAMQKSVVRLAESKKPQGKAANAVGSLNLGQLANSVARRVGGQSILTNQQLNQAATVRINLQERVDRLRTTVSIIKGGARALPAATLALLLAAVAIAYNRRHTITAIGITVLLLGIALLIAFKVWSGNFLGDITNASYHAAATSVYEAFYGDLRLRLIWTIVFGIALILLAAIAGPYSWAQRLRHALAIDKFQKTWPYRWAVGCRQWIARYEVWVELGGLAAAIIWLLTLSALTPAMLIIIISLLVAFVSLIHIIARPSPSRMLL